MIFMKKKNKEMMKKKVVEEEESLAKVMYPGDQRSGSHYAVLV